MGSGLECVVGGNGADRLTGLREDWIILDVVDDVVVVIVVALLLLLLLMRLLRMLFGVLV